MYNVYSFYKFLDLKMYGSLLLREFTSGINDKK